MTFYDIQLFPDLEISAGSDLQTVDFRQSILQDFIHWLQTTTRGLFLHPAHAGNMYQEISKPSKDSRITGIKERISKFFTSDDRIKTFEKLEINRNNRTLNIYFIANGQNIQLFLDLPTGEISI